MWLVRMKRSWDCGPFEFGHTAAHAIEKNTGYTKYNHGEAVAIGMVCAAYISKALGMIDQSVVDRVISLILKLHLPIKAQGCTVEDCIGIFS